MTLKKHHKIILLVIFIFAVLVVIAANIKTTKAIVSLPFGGSIAVVDICNEGIRIFVGPPFIGSYIFTPSSRRLTPTLLIPRKGQFTLGLFKPILMTCTKVAVPSGYGYPIIMAGGSL